MQPAEVDAILKQIIHSMLPNKEITLKEVIINIFNQKTRGRTQMIDTISQNTDWNDIMLEA